jgi:hypothetical protein
MINMIQLLNYCLRIVIQPISTATRIVRERNPKTSYFAVWLALFSIIVDMVLYSQNAIMRLEKQGVHHSAAVTLDFIGIFVMAPLTFFLGRFLFVVTTKGGLRIINRRGYPKQAQERLFASDTLRMIYPYLFIPIAIQMLLQLLFYPVSTAGIAILQFFSAIYVIVLQIVFIKRIYNVSGVVAFFSPMIVWWLIFVVFWLVWMITTGLVFVLSHFT